MLVATLAHAVGPTAADRETARTLLEQGRVLVDKGDLKEALKRYKAADDIMHVPSTALRVAKTQAALGLLVEARDTIAEMLRTPEKPSDPKPFKEARAEAAALDAKLASRVPALVIVVKGAAENEEPTLALDGVDLPSGVLGLPRVVDPGHHVVVAKTPRGEGKEEVDVAEAEQKRVEITLVLAPAPPLADQAPPAGETPATTSKTVHTPTILTWGGIGLGGAGVVVGAVTGGLSLSKKSTLNSECPNHICGPSGYSTLNSANTLATVSDIAFIAAGVGAGVAVVSLVLGHKLPSDTSAPPPAAAWQLQPWFGLGVGGVRGAF